MWLVSAIWQVAGRAEPRALLGFCGPASVNLAHMPDVDRATSTGCELPCCSVYFSPRWFWREGGDTAKGNDDSTHGLASVLFLYMWLLYI